MNVPFVAFANIQLKSAVRAPPTWSEPVGLGAKRTRGVLIETSAADGVAKGEEAINGNSSSQAGAWSALGFSATIPCDSRRFHGLALEDSLGSLSHSIVRIPRAHLHDDRGGSR
jgi:hypothetical protein